MMDDYNAARAGWYYDPFHQQPVYVFWNQTMWKARFVWQTSLNEVSPEQADRLGVQDETLTLDMYHRLVPLTQPPMNDYTHSGGCAIRGLYGMRHLVQIKPAMGGQGVFIQAPARNAHGQCDALCQAIWISDDEIPTIIRALQARRREILRGRDTREAQGENEL
jgi:hypothetical protein